MAGAGDAGDAASGVEARRQVRSRCERTPLALVADVRRLQRVTARLAAEAASAADEGTRR